MKNFIRVSACTLCAAMLLSSCGQAATSVSPSTTAAATTGATTTAATTTATKKPSKTKKSTTTATTTKPLTTAKPTTAATAKPSKSKIRTTTTTAKKWSTTTTAQKRTTTTTSTTVTSTSTTTTTEITIEATIATTAQDYYETKAFFDESSNGFISYLFHEPIRDTGESYPLVIFLHGLGNLVNESSWGLATEFTTSMMMLENEYEEYGAYTLAPSTPFPNQGWWTETQLTAFKKLIYQLIDDYKIDPKRIYITGISMGGFVTCQLVDEMPPNTFAAAVPLSGASNMSDPESLHNTAFRIYHSSLDKTVNVSCSRALNQQLLSSGHPKVEYIEFQHGHHTSPLRDVYSVQRYTFFEWLFAQRLP